MIQISKSQRTIRSEIANPVHDAGQGGKTRSPERQQTGYPGTKREDKRPRGRSSSIGDSIFQRGAARGLGGGRGMGVWALFSRSKQAVGAPGPESWAGPGDENARCQRRGGGFRGECGLWNGVTRIPSSDDSGFPASGHDGRGAGRKGGGRDGRGAGRKGAGRDGRGAGRKGAGRDGRGAGRKGAGHDGRGAGRKGAGRDAGVTLASLRRHLMAHLMSTTRAALSVSVPMTSCFPSGANVTL